MIEHKKVVKLNYAETLKRERKIVDRMGTALKVMIEYAVSKVIQDNS